MISSIKDFKMYYKNNMDVYSANLYINTKLIRNIYQEL